MAGKGKKVSGSSKSSAGKSGSRKTGSIKTVSRKTGGRKSQAVADGSVDVYRASLNDVRISPQKARLVMNLVRGQHVERALDILRFSVKKGARLIEKLVRSAVANAQEQARVDVDRLVVGRCWVDGGRTMKRFMPRARGSADQILKRSSHLTVELVER